MPAKSREELAKELLDTCAKEIEQRPDVHRTARLHYEMARLCEGPLGDLDEAVKHYELAHQLSKEHLPSLRGARRALVSAGKAQKALPYFDAEARLTSEPTRRAMLHYEKGLLLEDALGQHREAKAAFAAALELDESNPTLLKSLERAQRRASAWDELAGTYERAANSVSSDPRHRAALIAERARIIEARRKKTDDAIELYQSAVALDPNAPGAIAALKSLLYAHARWTDLIAVLAQASGLTGDETARALGHYAIGRLQWDRLGNLDEAIVALEQAAKDAPGEPMILEELARGYEVAKRWDQLVAVLSTLAERVSKRTEQVAVYHRIAQVAEERLGDEDVAIEWYGKCLGVDPGYLPALQALGKLRTRRQEWTSLIAMHLAEAGAVKDVARRAAAHARVADVLEGHLGKTDQAIEHHARALGLVPGYPPSFKALSRLYFDTGRHRELCELYERAIDLAQDDETRIAYLFRVGRLQEDALGAPRAGLAAYARILEISPKHVGAMHASQRAAERARLWDALLESLDYEVERTMDRAVKAAILHRAGEVAEDHLRDDERALERYRKVVEMDPGYLPALSSLGRLYYRAGRWEDLLGVYRLELAKAPRGAEAATLLHKMGELAEERVGRDDEALRYYRQAVDADAENAVARDALVRMLSGRGEHAEVVKILQQALEHLDEPGDHARMAVRVGEICEHRLGQVDRALEAYGKALGAVPDFRPAIDARARLLEQKRDYKALAEALGKESESTKDPAAAVAAKYREGEVWRDLVEQPKRAIEAFEAVLVRDPNHLGALLALEPLYAATEAWEALAQNFAAQARIFQNGFARAAALREQARVEEARGLRTPEELAQEYMAIIRMTPGDSSALGVLERIGLSSKDWALLAHVDAKLSALPDDPALVAAHETRLAESLEASGDPSALDTFRSAISRDPDNLAAAHGFARLADRAREPALMAEAAGHVARVLRDPDRAASMLVESARVAAMHGDVARAAQYVEQALDTHADHAESAEALEELLIDAGDVARLVDVLSRAAGAAKDKARRADLWVRVGALRAEREGDIGAGLGAIARALKDVPRHLPALMKQAELYSRDRQHKQAAQALEQVIAAKPDSAMLTVARVALARLLHDELGDTQGALSHLQKVLDTDPAHRGAIGLMLEVRVARGEGADATALAQKLVEEARNDAERAGALRQLAALERKRGRRADAAKALGQALEIAGVEVLDEFESLLGEQAASSEKPSHRIFADAVARYVDAQRDAPGVGPLQVALGRVQYDELGEVASGLAAFRKGVALSGGTDALRVELADRLMRAEHPEEAAEELRGLLESDPFRVETWQSLVDALRAAGKKPLAAVALQPLVALGGGSDLDRVAIQTRTPNTAGIGPGAFDANVLRSVVVSQPEDEKTTALLVAVAPLLSKIYPAELEAYGVTSRDRLSTRSGNPLRALADRIAQVFGVEDYEVYIHKAHKGGIEVEFEDDPAVMVPAHVVKLSQAEQTFLLARAFCDIARGLHLVDKLAQAEVAALLVASTRTVEPSYGDGVVEEARLGPLTRRVQKAMPWLGRRPVEDAARAYAPSEKPSLEEWLLRTRMTSARAAAIVADDLGATLAVLRRLEGESGRGEAGARKRVTAVLADALRFSISESAVTVRKRLGLG